ncbi:MAG TPA: hypothetical protein DDY78_26665 [Planctomycetales bacterium]|jgi:hypothetical protein|nr:hypothetical protein [Planctomycetales bacterium]
MGRLEEPRLLWIFQRADGRLLVGVRETMGVFDQASHYAVKLNPAGFFAWRVPRFAAHFVFLGWLDVSTIAFPGEPDRVCDTVAEFKARDGGLRRLMDVECQTEPDGDILERLGEYGLRLRREKRHGPGQGGKYQVVSLLLNLTGPVQLAELDLREVDLDGDGLHLRVTQGTLREEDAAATLARIASGEWKRCVLPWLPLMRGGENGDIIEEWKRLAQTEPDDRRRSDYAGLALVFADLAGRRAVWKEALEGWNMKVSQQVLEWQAEARQEGLMEGEIGQARAKLMRVLEVRFGSSMPKDLASEIAAQHDRDILDRWFDVAISGADLDAFRAAVREGK